MDLTPKEKAKELFDKYQIAGSQWYVETTKKYTLIAVDEIIKIKLLWFQKDTKELDYWQEVKEELLNM